MKWYKMMTAALAAALGLTGLGCKPGICQDRGGVGKT